MLVNAALDLINAMASLDLLKKRGHFEINVPLIFIVFLLSLLSYLGLRSYNGYCFSQGRTLSNEEKIDRALEDLLKTHHAGKDIQLGGLKFIPYANKDEFLRMNPDCCSLSKEIPLEGTTRLNFIDRLLGLTSDFVNIEYISRLQDASGKIDARKIKTYPTVSNCGDIH